MMLSGLHHVIGMAMGAILFARSTAKKPFNWIDYSLFIAAVGLLFI